MKLTWHGHACFQIEEDGWSVVCDPYAPGYVPGLLDLSAAADEVFCSHSHGDHNYVQGVTLSGNGERRFSVTAVDCWHDDAGGTLRGPNRIHIFDLPSGLRAVHLGDLGHLLTEEQVSAIGTPDVLMIPVGGFYTIDGKEAREIMDLLHPVVTIPMHYKTEYNAEWPISGPEVFLEGIPEKDIRRDIEVLRITERDRECQPRVALFKA